MKRIALILILSIGLIYISYGLALAGGTICVQATGCNDIKFTYMDTPDPSVYELNGWEYGCGKSDRLVYGTARAVGNKVYLNFQKGVMVSGVAGDTSYNATLTSGTGPANGFAQRMTGDFTIPDTFTFISCPVATRASEGPDKELP